MLRSACIVTSLLVASPAFADPRAFGEIGGRIGMERVQQSSARYYPLVGADAAFGVRLTHRLGLVARGHVIAPNLYVLPFPKAHGGFIGFGGQLFVTRCISVEGLVGFEEWTTMPPIESGEFSHTVTAGGVAAHGRVNYALGAMWLSVSTTPVIIDTDENINTMTVVDLAFTIAYHGYIQ